MQTTIQYIEKELSGLYPKTEVQAFTRIIFESVCGWSFTEQILKRKEFVSAEKLKEIEGIIARLKTLEPLQYILGETEFYGMRLLVNSSVLIPRPETEELVQWIVQSNLPEKCRILDIGTGSGCIALALKKMLKDSEISAIDISEKALEVAKENAIQNKFEIDFLQRDILNWEHFEWKKFDLIVSNPPYVRNKEKTEMLENVLKFEPGKALFVSDEDPLIFYRKIAAFAAKHLTDNGNLFFEINENLADEMKVLLKDFGFGEIEIRKDLNRKNRMLSCKRLK